MLLFSSTPDANMGNSYISLLAPNDKSSENINSSSTPQFEQSQESSGDTNSGTNEEWLYSTLYLYNTIWISYTNTKKCYTYSKTLDSSLISIDKIQENWDTQWRLRRLIFRVGSKQMIQFLKDMNQDFDAELYFEYPGADTSESCIVCHKSCVDEWSIGLLPSWSRKMSEITSVITAIHFNTDLPVKIIVTKLAVLQLKSYIASRNPELRLTCRSTFCGTLLSIQPGDSSQVNLQTQYISRSISQVLNFIEANYDAIALDFPLDCLPLAPATIGRLTSPVRIKSNICEIPQPTDIIQRTILFKKHEISFLMGFQGTRINSIRKSTACLIKVLPFATTLDVFMPTRNAPQDLVFCGTQANVQHAIGLIQSYLNDYRNNGFIH